MTSRPPVCTIASLFIGPVLGFVSIPFWHFEVSRQTADSPDGGQFGLVAIIAFATATALGGAVLGVVLAGVGQFRRERLLAFRIFTILVNAALIGTGIYLLRPFISNE